MKQKPYVVVVGMDFSEVADRALDEALGLASAHENADLHVVSVLPVPGLDPRYAIPVHAVLDEAGALEGAVGRLKAHVQRVSDKFSSKTPGVALPRIHSHVSIDVPARGLAQLASDLEANLLVVGTHNRKGIERFLLGSVAEGAVRHARCPVLVIPAIEEVEEIKLDPPCPNCVQARRESAGKELWCAQHRERHGRRHTYHEPDRAGAGANFPLVYR